MTQNLPLTLSENWLSFSREVIPLHAPPEQLREMSRAFHAGFCRAWEILTHEVADMPEDDAMQFMDKMESEIVAYVSGLMKVAGIDPNQSTLFQADTENPQ